MRKFIKANYPERVHTVDFGRLFVCEDNVKLCNVLSGGDGIHLAPYAYHMALWEIRNTLLADGLPKQEDNSSQQNTTATAEADINTAENTSSAESAEPAE